MREKDIEIYLIEQCKKQNIEALKFEVRNRRGMPDRILLIPGGEAVFVEVKAPGKKPRPLQIKRMKDLKRLGFKTYVVDSYKKIDEMIEVIR